MPSLPEEQHALLIAVLKRVNTTTIDFQAVGEEMGITKSAATKRWNRYVERTLKNSGMVAENKEKKEKKKGGKKGKESDAAAGGAASGDSGGEVSA